MEQKKQTRRVAKPYSDINNGKIPPQALDLESAVLGGIILEPHAIIHVVGFLRPEVFYQESHRLIYQACLDLYTESKPIDLLTVKRKLNELGNLDKIGGAYYLTGLTSNLASTANLEAHARYLMECWCRRELIRHGHEISQLAYDDSSDIFTIMDQAAGEVDRIQEEVLGEKLSDDVSGDVLTAIANLRHKPTSNITGVPSGCNTLDLQTSGFQKSDLIYLMARPGMGKTSWMLECIKTACEKHFRVAVFSIEMPKNQLYYRLLSNMTGIAHKKIKKRTLYEQEHDAIWVAGEQIKKWSIYVNDSPRINPITIRTALRIQQRKWGKPVDIVVIDYLQMLTTPSHEKFKSRDQEVQYLSRELKAIAKEFDCPVMCIASMSRKCEERTNKRPEMSDARDSGSIESDADLLLALYRSSQYYDSPEKERDDTYQMMNLDDYKRASELLVLKYRHGETGVIMQEFHGEIYQFKTKELEYDDQPF